MNKSKFIGDLVHKAELGFFAQPVNYENGRVIKNYRGDLSSRDASKTVSQHEEYIDNLRRIGVRVPPTEMRAMLNDRGSFNLKIIQEKFNPSELAGEICINGKPREAVSVARGISREAIKFLESDMFGKWGFHPTLRNYAFRNGDFYLFDTFPPYSSESETRRMMLRHAPNVPAKIMMGLIYPFLGAYTSEYYQPALMIGGIVGTATRLRPELEDEIREKILEDVYQSNIPDKEETISRLRKPINQGMKWKLAHRLYNKSK